MGVPGDAASGRVQRRTELENEMIPGGAVAGAARGSQREVLDVQRREIPRDLFIRGSVRKSIRGAAVEGLRQRLLRQRPALGAALHVDSRNHAGLHGAEGGKS